MQPLESGLCSHPFWGGTGEVISRNYGYNSGIDTTISRISTIADDGGTDAGTVAAYTYLGLNTIVVEDDPQINTELTYMHVSGDTLSSGDGGDEITGLDRFGRVIDQFYYDTSTDTTVSRVQYGYDRDGNVLYADNLVNSAYSELYHANSSTSGDDNSAYDPLSRITSFRRGTLTSSGNNGSTLDTITSGNLNSTTGVPNTNSWSLDAIGNFGSENGTSNTFNSQNEETANGSNSITYDNNGNMLTDEAGEHLTYDAWNHVVKITNSGGSDIGDFTYGPLGLQIINNNGAGNDDYYYSAQGQIIEEYFTAGIYEQYVYGLAYVNDLILRDRNADSNMSTGNLGISGSGLEEREYAEHDSQFSVIALTNSSGTITERVAYDPYGSFTFLTPSWTAGSDGTNYWVALYQGMRLLNDAGVGNFFMTISRIYDAPMGRWISQDGGYWDGRNLYLAFDNNPADLADPAGADPEACDEAQSYLAYFKSAAADAFAAARKLQDAKNKVTFYNTIINGDLSNLANISSDLSQMIDDRDGTNWALSYLDLQVGTSNVLNNPWVQNTNAIGLGMPVVAKYAGKGGGPLAWASYLIGATGIAQKAIVTSTGFRSLYSQTAATEGLLQSTINDLQQQNAQLQLKTADDFSQRDAAQNSIPVLEDDLDLYSSIARSDYAQYLQFKQECEDCD